MKELIWFNVSVLYSASCAAFAVSASAEARRVLVFFAVHGALWAIYRAMALNAKERAAAVEVNTRA